MTTKSATETIPYATSGFRKAVDQAAWLILPNHPAMSGPITDGFIPFKGYRTWYKIVGERDAAGKLPLLLLHGGPGAGHDYLWPLAKMARKSRRVIFYDQIGCGLSHINESKLGAVHWPARALTSDG